MTIASKLAAAVFAGSALFAAPFAIQGALAQEVVASGDWTKVSFRAKGEWSIAKDGDALIITLDEDFSTRRGPDLKIFLSPKAPSAINGKNAVDGSVLVAELSSARGAQSYRIEGVDLSNYKSIIIHCEAFEKLWTVAAI